MSFSACMPCGETCPESCLKSCPESCSMTSPEIYSESCLKTQCKSFSENNYSDTCTRPCSFSVPQTDKCLKTYSEGNICPEICVTAPSEICLPSCPDACPPTCPDPCSSNTISTPCSNSISKTLSKRCGLMPTCPTKAYSVYSCGFGGSTRISSCTKVCSPCRVDGGCHGGLLVGGYGGRIGARIMTGRCYGNDFDYHQKSEKATMKNLNDRLASYLEKVRCLEAANAALERQICEYYEKKGSICQRDYSCYLNTINCLQEKIRCATISNANILLRIDNLKLAADDFRMKYENEVAIRQCVKADIANLQAMLEKTCLSKGDLEMQVCSLEEELAYLRKAQKEDVAALMCQLTNTVCVEVDAAPQQDLNKILNEIRCHYETIIDNYHRKQNCWFTEKMAEVCKDVATNTECLEPFMAKISDLRRVLQNLQIELQSEISKKGALECSLLETEARYSAMLAGLQKHINLLEAELCQVRSGIEQQGTDYAALLNIKSRLEQEIATYRCLLENQDTEELGGLF